MAQKKAATPPAPKGPDRAAVDALMKVVNDSKPKKKATDTPDPEELPKDWGVGDLMRVGKARLSHAVFGKPKAAEAEKQKKY